MTMNTMTATSTPNPIPSGGRLVSVDGLELPLKGAWIRANASGGRARVELTQTFVNAEDSVLDVIYKVPLPADGAVCGYRFVVGDCVSSGYDSYDYYPYDSAEGFHSAPANRASCQTGSPLYNNCDNFAGDMYIKVIRTSAFNCDGYVLTITNGL
jgi:hypothetical protein